MWKLTHSKKEHLESYLFVGEEFVVGRKDSSLLISKDPSVSRRHAVLHVEHPEQNLGDPSKKSSLFMKDEGSKYGTFKNGVRVSGQIELSDNDIIKFGQFESEFKVLQSPLVVTTSCLAVPAKRDLKKTIHTLGGHLVSEWQSSCTHLTMTEVKVTIKALCCLLSTKPIVKPEYFQDLKKNLKTSNFLLPNSYVPPIGEALIDKDVVSFDINPQRKVLFRDKTFFFLDEKQYKKLHLGIVLGGGSATILTSDNLDPEQLLRDDCCVIDPNKESQSSLEVRDILPTVISILLKKKLRLIPESDIGLSVAYCSTEKFCNPKVNGDILNSSRIQSQTLTQREVYVPDTEDKTARIELQPKSVKPSEACSSLHLSSFQIGTPVPEEVSEVPLSVQVKRELDDIFDLPAEIKPEIPAEAEVDAPASPERPPKRLKRSVVQQNKETPVQEDDLDDSLINPDDPDCYKGCDYTDSNEDDPFSYYQRLAQAYKIQIEDCWSVETLSSAYTSACTDLGNDLTKRGAVRKRKKYYKSLGERKNDKLRDKIKKHQIKASCSCSKDCGSKISNDRRLAINGHFWSLSSCEQQVYVSAHISPSVVKRRRSESEKRNVSLNYSLRDENGEFHQVCKTFFLTTLGFNPKNDRMITNALCNAKNGLVYAVDNRGRNAKPKIDRDIIVKHVELFLSNVSHGGSEHAPNKRYSPNDIRVTDMHKDFINRYPDVQCSYELYRKCVNDLNISFINFGHEDSDAYEHLSS